VARGRSGMSARGLAARRSRRYYPDSMYSGAAARTPPGDEPLTSSRMPPPRAWQTPFWNRATETMPRAALDRLHLARVQALLAHAYERSAFYRRKLDGAGVHPNDIRSLDDLKTRVPITDKSEFIGLQQA